MKKDNKLIKEAITYAYRCARLRKPRVKWHFVSPKQMKKLYGKSPVALIFVETNHIFLNTRFWSKASKCEKWFLILHEVAHDIVSEYYDFRKLPDHGKEWIQVMKLLGVRNPRAHFCPDAFKKEYGAINYLKYGLNTHMKLINAKDVALAVISGVLSPHGR